mmetsp:Transcript_4809/g.11263  ORF Transcript_4809/g.11263 Transcript_4809/m.11263 type:complete len:240 (-) Transcript_4809:1370-2089(-)
MQPAEEGPGVGVVGVDCEGLQIPRRRLAHPPLPLRHLPQPHVGVEVVGALLEDGAVQSSCCRRPLLALLQPREVVEDSDGAGAEGVAELPAPRHLHLPLLARRVQPVGCEGLVVEGERFLGGEELVVEGPDVVQELRRDGGAAALEGGARLVVERERLLRRLLLVQRPQLHPHLLINALLPLCLRDLLQLLLGLGEVAAARTHTPQHLPHLVAGRVHLEHLVQARDRLAQFVLVDQRLP